MKVLWHFNSAFWFTLLYFDSCFSHLPPSPHSTPPHRSVPPLACSLLWSAVLVSLSQYGCPDSRGRWRSGLNTGGRKSQRRVWQSHLDSYGKVWRANNNNEEVWNPGGCRGGWESPRETSKRRQSCFSICLLVCTCVLPPSPSTDTSKPNQLTCCFASLPMSSHGSHVENLTSWKIKLDVRSVPYTFVSHHVYVN